MDASRRILGALDKVYREGKHTTRDVGGTGTTQEFTQAVIAEMGDWVGQTSVCRVPFDLG